MEEGACEVGDEEETANDDVLVVGAAWTQKSATAMTKNRHVRKRRPHTCVTV